MFSTIVSKSGEITKASSNSIVRRLDGTIIPAIEGLIVNPGDVIITPGVVLVESDSEITQFGSAERAQLDNAQDKSDKSSTANKVIAEDFDFNNLEATSAGSVDGIKSTSLYALQNQTTFHRIFVNTLETSSVSPAQTTTTVSTFKSTVPEFTRVSSEITAPVVQQQNLVAATLATQSVGSPQTVVENVSSDSSAVHVQQPPSVTIPAPLDVVTTPVQTTPSVTKIETITTIQVTSSASEPIVTTVELDKNVVTKKEGDDDEFTITTTTTFQDTTVINTTITTTTSITRITSFSDGTTNSEQLEPIIETKVISESTISTHDTVSVTYSSDSSDEHYEHNGKDEVKDDDKQKEKDDDKQKEKDDDKQKDDGVKHNNGNENADDKSSNSEDKSNNSNKASDDSFTDKDKSKESDKDHALKIEDVLSNSSEVIIEDSKSNNSHKNTGNVSSMIFMFDAVSPRIDLDKLKHHDD